MARPSKLLMVCVSLGMFATVLLFTITSTAHGQTAEQQITEETTLKHHIIAFLSFVASGIFYSASGYVKKIRRKLARDDSVALDYTKMGKSLLIGVILGIGAFVYTTYEGTPLSIHTPHEFLTQVGINTAVILVIDKWFLGHGNSNGTMKTREPLDLTLADVDEFMDDEQDGEPERLPPGKSQSGTVESQ